jgi:EAL domain-containing protein (putative c-di-GMP-specific phosphodiesterase class I)
VRIALDDFGAGASSFSYLKSLNVDFLKIDGQFIYDLVDSPLDQAAVRCFGEVAKLAGLKTVAEFVHDAAALAQVSAMKIDYAQGYFIHRPAPLADLVKRQSK